MPQHRLERHGKSRRWHGGPCFLAPGTLGSHDPVQPADYLDARLSLQRGQQLIGIGIHWLLLDEIAEGSGTAKVQLRIPLDQGQYLVQHLVEIVIAKRIHVLVRTVDDNPLVAFGIGFSCRRPKDLEN